ncbi:hypothetical protein CONLIGDRAFT_672999 [Coniochaeta ligniaria NRRL 30616]|uniref:DUF3752 domain-containing protein n=1 Tax=Coniochaeta ligniaria NRRL 30616 TaxID=1408157 RepID=A0A1J7JEV2_9PEZI|nr:hypothetical protein CONLIGDRAFT_672999 [Coniochaeta ligniaria NRRL 30616]
MSSIGPRLPPHLQKRKRTPEDDDAPESPPSKTMRPANNDEIALDSSSSDDDYGPSKGPAPQKPPQHGPTLPSPTTSAPKPSIGPAMPPPPTSKPTSIGPTPPPAPLSTRPSTNPQQTSPDSDSSDSDDDYGPSLPTSTTHQSRLSALPTGPSYSSAAPEPPKRDDWMLAPPSAPTSYRERDPTKLKARKFASGRAAAGNEAHAGGVSAIWTETPEEKAKRLRDAVLGRGGAEEGARRAVEEKMVVAAPRGETADEERIRSFTEQTRGRSLYEEHQMRKNKGKEEEKAVGEGKKKGAEEEDDDPSKRAFSWEKDMKASGTISHTQRRQLLAKSADFGGRFDKGRYL